MIVAAQYEHLISFLQTESCLPRSSVGTRARGLPKPACVLLKLYGYVASVSLVLSDVSNVYNSGAAMQENSW